jgi:hypothetical protein
MFRVQKISTTHYPSELGRPQPRQFLLHNFMSHESPYNGLLLYHGLGTGKEETVRMVTQDYAEYMRKTNRVKPIYVDATFEAELAAFLAPLDEAHVATEVQRKYSGAMFVLNDVHKNDYSSLYAVLEHATVKLLLLSPTPMFSKPTDIVAILNLLRVNDKRRRILPSDVFNPDSTLRDNGEPLVEYVHGYVAFVKGENPASFPFRIYPSMFQKKKWKYPAHKRGGDLVRRVEIVDIYPVYPETPQLEAYRRAATDEEGLMALTMSYPGGLFGAQGWATADAAVFEPHNLPMYSAKIAAMCRSVQSSTGICLVYTRFYQGGALPAALALESMGFSRHTGASVSGKPKTPLKYALWNGAPNAAEWAAAVHPANSDGELLKVVVVTDVDGVDLANVRQIHVLDPWPHMERLERLIGRGIRLDSHQALPLEARNCQVFLYASLMDEEAADMYVYRQAETNALKTGQVTRLLRLNAMNCVVNYAARPLKTVLQRLANGKTIHYQLGDKDGSAACDYLTCLGNTPVKSTLDVAAEIGRVFKHHYVLSSRELVREVRMLNPDYNRAYILEAARDLVYRVQPVVDRLGTTGYLAHADDTFLFQPFELGCALAQVEADFHGRDPWCAVAAESGTPFLEEAMVGHLVDCLPDASALLLEVVRRHKTHMEKLIFSYFQKNKYGDQYVLKTREGVKYFTLEGEPTTGALVLPNFRRAKYVGVVDGHFKVREGGKGRECVKVLKELTKTRPRNRFEACVELELLLRRTDAPESRCFLTPLEYFIGGRR